ncbi:hypothetical protein ACHAXR_003017, partial [Thalassiosira sp. AJA248-18]
MKRPRSSITAFSLFAIALSSPPHHPQLLASAASLRATQDPASDDGLTVKLSSSSHPRAAVSSSSSSGKFMRTDHAPEIPLIGVGVGNLPHNKIPYILASALSSPPKKKKKKKSGMEELNYRLIDTSHTDSALEVLVGRSLSRLPSSSGGGSNGNTKNAATTTTGNDTYHVMIKIRHTHLGYERTTFSVKNSLSDILPGTAGQVGSNNNNADAKNVAAQKNKKTSAAGTGPNVLIHAILQYPRCYDSLFHSQTYLASPNFAKKYASCKQEEESLDDATKRSGPSPLLDKENAWKRSYRALEELYHHGTLESIGLSNFGPADLAQVFELATVGPHVYQGSLSTLLTQEELVEELVKHGVHYQCYDVASTILNGREGAPSAYAKLERIGATHGAMVDNDEQDWIGGKSSDSSGDAYGYSPVQVVLGWLVHHRGVGVVPGTTNGAHLAENSPMSLGSMPRFSPREALDVETAVLALVNAEEIDEDSNGTSANGAEEVIDASGSHHGTINSSLGVSIEGEEGVVATFFNTLPSRSIRIFHVHPGSGEQMQLSHSIPPGRSGRMIVNTEDVLIAYDGHGVAVKKFLVEEEVNGSVDFA